jgi:hypothetical protein
MQCVHPVKGSVKIMHIMHVFACVVLAALTCPSASASVEDSHLARSDPHGESDSNSCLHGSFNFVDIYKVNHRESAQ